MKIYLESLGCVKNLVDSEFMLGRLEKAGYTIIKDPAEAEAIIINTCSFIESAVNESIDTILELAELKKDGACKRIVVTGCLPERFREEIVSALPEVDIFLGTGAFCKIVEAVSGRLNISENSSVCFLPDPSQSIFPIAEEPRVLFSPHTAYLKIAEGCSKRCSYCIIPKLRGKQRSRYLEDIIAEAHLLIASGVKELILVAQDTTNYGKDLLPESNFQSLIENISAISENVWLRFLYGHPETISDSLINTIAEHKNICSYFDLPIQHSSNQVLKRMGRHYTSDDLFRIFDKIRTVIPDAAIRTTLITGFPGETEKNFKHLLNFIENVCFDHLGVFVYSDFRELSSHKLPNHVPENIAKIRYEQLMSRQAEISLEKNKKHIGKNYKVLVETSLEKQPGTGRAYFQAPEVDGITYINSEKPQSDLKIGSFTNVRITEALEYDLVGERYD